MSKKRFEDLDLIDNYLVMAMASDPEAGPVYGRLLAEGTPDKVLNDPAVVKAYLGD